jgi:hypothetical protein
LAYCSSASHLLVLMSSRPSHNLDLMMLREQSSHHCVQQLDNHAINITFQLSSLNSSATTALCA